MIQRIARKIARRMNFQRWRSSNRRNHTFIHPSVYLSGDAASRTSDIQIGTRCTIERQITIWFPKPDEAGGQLTIGDDVFVGQNTQLAVFAPIEIGKFTMIGANSYIVSNHHNFESRSIAIQQQGFVGGPIKIGEDVWLGTHVVVLPNVQIGRGAIVAAGSVVNKDIPEYEVWGGVPAKFLKQRPE